MRDEMVMKCPPRRVIFSKRSYHQDPGVSESNASAYNAGDSGSIPGWARCPGEGNGNPLQYSCLENPMDGGAWVGKSQTGLSSSRRGSLRPVSYLGGLRTGELLPNCPIHPLLSSVPHASSCLLSSRNDARAGHPAASGLVPAPHHRLHLHLEEPPLSLQKAR